MPDLSTIFVATSLSTATSAATSLGKPEVSANAASTCCWVTGVSWVSTFPKNEITPKILLHSGESPGMDEGNCVPRG